MHEVVRVTRRFQAVPQATHIINIQGDEPLIDPALIDELAATMAAHPSLDMATAANPLDPADVAVQDPNVVKVAIALDGRALYFSRSPLVFQSGVRIAVAEYRQYRRGIWSDARLSAQRCVP